jgi:hypothetical protein
MVVALKVRTPWYVVDVAAASMLLTMKRIVWDDWYSPTIPIPPIVALVVVSFYFSWIVYLLLW